MDPERLAAELEATGDYRVLRRFRPEMIPLAAPEPDPATGVVLDVETTGLDPASDRIIQLSVVPFQYGRESGRITAIGAPLTSFEDPGRPIPALVVGLTGITDADVAGRRIDDAAVESAVGSALVIAHNAAFDRPFMERRLPLFRRLPWGCSRDDIPWKRLGASGSSLEFLLIKHCGVFHAAHRADHDCLGLLHLLATPFASGETPFQLLLAGARRKTVRLRAVEAPMAAKDLLKRRGYRWNNGDNGRPRAWWTEVAAEDQAAEEAWLAENVYGGRPVRPVVEVLDARSRYSDRSDS